LLPENQLFLSYFNLYSFFVAHMMKNSSLRFRFAPSPTGALHIGGIRTALYNYLLAKKLGGTFILRIEDTDQSRYVEGAEKYILDSLNWCGIQPDEGPDIGGNCGPYRQSERTAIYDRFIEKLILSGHAYYAFDTTEELEKYRSESEHTSRPFKYDSFTRLQLNNSLALPAATVEEYLEKKIPYTVRLKVPEDESILVQDNIRGEVVFHSQELDDKVLRKADGLPTYHLANVVDDHLMQISHVIRGEEWLPSTAHHVLIYKALGLEKSMPEFAHLPLILKPTGNGKLSKRDGEKLGIPVFPISWIGESGESVFKGFRELGFLPAAMLNFLAFLGWNPGTEQEIFTQDQLIEAFDIDEIGKAGARFDYEKAKWFNRQYIIQATPSALSELLMPLIPKKYPPVSDDYLLSFCRLMQERVTTLHDFFETGYYFFEPVHTYDTKNIANKWSPSLKLTLQHLMEKWSLCSPFNQESLQLALDTFMEEHRLKPGDILPVFRIGLAGTMKGPGVMDLIELWGMEEVSTRMNRAFEYFDQILLH
jgi:glutamyl-tRNA synthetase